MTSSLRMDQNKKNPEHKQQVVDHDHPLDKPGKEGDKN